MAWKLFYIKSHYSTKTLALTVLGEALWKLPWQSTQLFAHSFNNAGLLFLMRFNHKQANVAEGKKYFLTP